ncbi:hypothetical protein O181_065951 [Austropuccinia psidii MF-1]|uniref:Uncharacterized protein n=1 Tax=Austropuccinia psidii MF-1 TaxID=1389203 RepID=A0A9Q3EWM3_9BASI|nr:hypothetical protein [Austropuccinia psidii MF-1]
MGKARFRILNNNKKAIGNIESKGWGGVRWVDVQGGDKKGDVLISIDYINAEISYGNVRHSSSNSRNAVITVNDNEKVIVNFPISGQTWEDVYEGFLVTLPLEAGEVNKILIEGLDGPGPDIVSIGVEQIVNPTT